MDGMTTLKCVGVGKSFDGVHALTDLNLDFPPSGVVAIIGPNGAGKTTLFNVMTGFVHPEFGQVFLGERELTHLPPHAIARLGIARTFQELRLISQSPALENVLLARPNQKGERLVPALLRFGVAAEEAQNRCEALRWLRFVRLQDAADCLAGELSYGQQKLLNLACCLATDAPILLLDEPVTGIHPEMVLHISDLLCQLRGLGKQIVLIEHNIAFVRQVADHVIVMDGGEIISEGRPSDVLERPEIFEAYVR